LRREAGKGYVRRGSTGMVKSRSSFAAFESRRREETLAFLVVKFLKAREIFTQIHNEFQDAVKNHCLAECGLAGKVWALVHNHAFDMKEKAHLLFRRENRKDKPARDDGGKAKARRAISELKASIEARAIDSYIGTGYHLLLILAESLYQLERYTPMFREEHARLSRVERLARKAGYTFSAEEEGELEHLRALSGISNNVNAETEELIFRYMARTESLFKGTAEVIRGFIEGWSDNEILIQNLLRNTDLLEKVYGKGSAERIFWAMCRYKRFEGRTGLEKALNLARARCGNVTGLQA
jgi:hypothetical protein